MLLINNIEQDGIIVYPVTGQLGPGGKVICKFTLRAKEISKIINIDLPCLITKIEKVNKIHRKCLEISYNFLGKSE